MFTALGHGYNLFSFKHTPINMSLSSKIYENTSFYFIYFPIYLFIWFICRLVLNVCMCVSGLCAYSRVSMYVSERQLSPAKQSHSRDPQNYGLRTGVVR